MTNRSITDTVLEELKFSEGEKTIFKDIIYFVKLSRKDTNFNLSRSIQDKVQEVLKSDLQ